MSMFNGRCAFRTAREPMLLRTHRNREPTTHCAQSLTTGLDGARSAPIRAGGVGDYFPLFTYCMRHLSERIAIGSEHRLRHRLASSCRGHAEIDLEIVERRSK